MCISWDSNASRRSLEKQQKVSEKHADVTIITSKQAKQLKPMKRLNFADPVDYFVVFPSDSVLTFLVNFVAYEH